MEEVAFVAVELRAEGDGPDRILALRTNVGDRFPVDDDHPLRFEIDPVNGGLKPYVRVRGRLEARLARPVLYDLVALGETVSRDGRDWFGVWSAGRFFAIVPADEIEAIG